MERLKHVNPIKNTLSFIHTYILPFIKYFINFDLTLFTKAFNQNKKKKQTKKFKNHCLKVIRNILATRKQFFIIGTCEIV